MMIHIVKTVFHHIDYMRRQFEWMFANDVVKIHFENAQFVHVVLATNLVEMFEKIFHFQRLCFQ